MTPEELRQSLESRENIRGIVKSACRDADFVAQVEFDYTVYLGEELPSGADIVDVSITESGSVTVWVAA